jgi:hypothetical protein
MRRSDICLYLGPADRAELQALLTNRNTARKLTWRAGIVLATAEGVGTVEIMRRTGMSKPTVWRWQALRANKSETFDCLKFTLGGAGERSDGNARTSAHALAYRA